MSKKPALRVLWVTGLLNIFKARNKNWNVLLNEDTCLEDLGLVQQPSSRILWGTVTRVIISDPSELNVKCGSD